jgi:O-antigen/teichoic acid export membrane protein
MIRVPMNAISATTKSSHQRSIARGVGWMLLFKLAERSLGIVSTLVLVRLLSPADFGVVAMAQSVIVMVQLLAAFGFDVALIRDQSASEEHYYTAWTMNVALGVVICAIVMSLAIPISHFYSKPELKMVVFALGFAALFQGFENIGVVAFRKELRFRSEFAFQLSRKLAGMAVTLPVAFIFHSYWALVAGTLASALVGTIVSYMAHPFRPRFCLAKASELLHFSRWLLVGNVISFVRDRSSDFFIGRLAGPAALGAYNVSYEISNMPTTELSAPINRALMPGFSALAGDPAAIRETYLHAFGILAMIAVPAAAAILSLAGLIVPVLLGTGWLDAVPLMEVLAICGVFHVLQSSAATALIATGHPKTVFTINAVYGAVLLVGLAVLVPLRGVIGAAYATAVAALLTTPLFMLWLRRHVGTPLAEIGRRIWRPVCGALVMFGVTQVTLPAYTPAMHGLVALGFLLAGAALAVAVYAATVLLLWMLAGKPRGAEQILLGQIKSMLPWAAAAKPVPQEPVA